MTDARRLVAVMSLLFWVACSREQAGPAEAIAPEPSSTTLGKLVVLTETTGQDVDPDGYWIVVGDSPGEVRRDAGFRDSITFAQIGVGLQTVRLRDVASNCDVSGGPEQTVSVSSLADARVVFRVTCARWFRGPGSAASLTGTWKAQKWEFAVAPPYGFSDDVVAGGLIGVLTLTAPSDSEVTWRWGETYRWGGPERWTMIEGRALVDTSRILSSFSVAGAGFECDWGDCRGPLHGEHTFRRTADTLVIAHAGPVEFWLCCSIYGSTQTATARLILVRGP